MSVLDPTYEFSGCHDRGRRGERKGKVSASEAKKGHASLVVQLPTTPKAVDEPDELGLDPLEEEEEEDELECDDELDELELLPPLAPPPFPSTRTAQKKTSTENKATIERVFKELAIIEQRIV